MGSRTELSEIGREPDVTLGMTYDKGRERRLVIQGNLDRLEQNVLIERADIADKNAAAASGALRLQEAIADREVRTVAQDQPAVAGLHDVLDYDCRPKCSGGRRARKGSATHIRRLIRADSKQYLIIRTMGRSYTLAGERLDHSPPMSGKPLGLLLKQCMAHPEGRRLPHKPWQRSNT